MDKSKKLVKNLAYMFTGTFASKILSFLLVPLYTGVLTTAEYGVSDLIFTSILLLLPIFSLVIYEPMLRFSLDEGVDLKKIFSTGLLIGILGFVVLFALSPIILLIDWLREYYWYCIGYYLIYLLYHCISYFVRGIGAIKVYSLAGVVNTVCMLAFNLFFLLVLKWGIIGYLLANILSNFMATVIAFVMARLYCYVDFKHGFDRKIMLEMVEYSIPMIPNSVSWWINNSSDRYMVSFISGVTVNGIYSVAYKIPSMISTIAVIVNSAWQLSAVDEFGSEESKKFYASVFKHFFSALCLVTGLVIFLTKPIAGVLYQADFYSAWKIVPILAVSVVFNSLSGFIGTIFTSTKNTKALMSTTMLGASANILLNLFLIPILQGTGAAIATLISYIIVYIMRIRKSNKYFYFKREKWKNRLSIIILVLESLVVITDISYSKAYSFILLLSLLWLRFDIISDFPFARRH